MIIITQFQLNRMKQKNMDEDFSGVDCSIDQIWECIRENDKEVPRPLLHTYPTSPD